MPKRKKTIKKELDALTEYLLQNSIATPKEIQKVITEHFWEF